MRTIQIGVYDSDHRLQWDSGEMVIDGDENWILFEEPFTIPAGGMLLMRRDDGHLLPIIPYADQDLTFDKMPIR